MTTLLAASDSGGGNFLVSPSLGLMIWTLLAFGITLYLLNKLAFPKIAAALDRRRLAIEESIEVANLTVIATEKITRKSLTDEDHRRLIEEALSEVNFEELAPSEGRGR